MLRSSNSDLNGMPQLQTPDAAMLLQASLQHVVLTYDPVNGRQIYVNGVNANVPDPQKGGTISNWDSTFALGARQRGLGRPLVAGTDQVRRHPQPRDDGRAGPAELQRRRRRALLHAVQRVGRAPGSSAGLRHVHGQPVRQLQLPVLPADLHLAGSDGRSRPAFPIKGIRIGINGTIPQVGQAYIPLNTTVTAANYTAQGEVLSNIGTVIGLENGPLTDQFFLHFDQLGTPDQRDRRADAGRAARAAWAGRGGCRCAHLRPGQLDAVGAHGRADHQCGGRLRPTQRAAAAAAVPTLEAFSSANQVGIAQLAIQYCNTMVNTPGICKRRCSPA